MRLLLSLLVLAGCAHRPAPPTLPVPNPSPGRVEAVAQAADPLGEVQPVAVAITSDDARPLQLDARQVYAHPVTSTDPRVAPLPPAEAARRAGGRRLPGAIRGGATGAASGGVLGAMGGAIAGAIQGGIGSAVSVGAAVGAALGAVTGVVGGSRAEPADVSGFTERGLPDMTLQAGYSATGYVYFPPGSYRLLEIPLVDDRGEHVLTVVTPIAPGS